jgi:3-phenylpropionate/trans-cinnamate dioxygenase ferredoxin reductase subunit
LHSGRGVKLLEGLGLRSLFGENGHVECAELADGSSISVDFVIVGIGVHPNVELAEEAGLEIDNGIAVDSYCRTSDPRILSAGDCASFPWRSGRIRLESVGNAIDQGESVARTIRGQSTGYEAKPWFWSDQFDVKLQIAGLLSGYDTVVTRRGTASSMSFWYYFGNTLLAVDAMNDARAYMIAKRLIDAGKSPAQELVADPDTDLKSLLGT